MSKTTKLPFSSSHEKGKDTKLRNEIAEIVAECCVDLNVPEATSQILSLLEGYCECKEQDDTKNN